MIEIKLNKTELFVLKETLKDYYKLSKVNFNEHHVEFDNSNIRIDAFDLINDRLIAEGFDENYELNRIGNACTNLSDKLNC